MNRYLYVFLVSMVPLIELRGAIPIGVGLGLPLRLALGAATGTLHAFSSAAPYR